MLLITQEEKDNYGLTPGQVEAFQEVFNLFDMNRGGTINASELDAVLQTVDIHLTPAEIVDILLVIDKNSQSAFSIIMIMHGA